LSGTRWRAWASVVPKICRDGENGLHGDSGGRRNSIGEFSNPGGGYSPAGHRSEGIWIATSFLPYLYRVIYTAPRGWWSKANITQIERLSIRVKPINKADAHPPTTAI
jgi:hypothetical protein